VKKSNAWMIAEKANMAFDFLGDVARHHLADLLDGETPAGRSGRLRHG